MTDRSEAPTNGAEDGSESLVRAAHQQTDEADAATALQTSRPAWLRFIPDWLLVLVELYLRRSLASAALGAAFMSIFVAFITDDPKWRVALLATAILGPILVIAVGMRRWPLGRQWLVISIVLAVELGLVVTCIQVAT